MLENPKHVFWQAFAAAIIVFAFGIWMGFLLENYRTSRAGTAFAKSEIDLLDIRLQSEIFREHQIDCTTAAEENIIFGDRVYEEAKELDRGKQANKLTDDIVYQHKKYDVLRTIFWMNSLNIRKKCNSNFHTVVYFYQYNHPDLDKKAEQGVVSDVLLELKENYGSSIMLIPLAADNNVTSLNLLLDFYNITYLPTVFIDEKIKIEGLTSVEDLEASLGKVALTDEDLFARKKIENPFV